MWLGDVSVGEKCDNLHRAYTHTLRLAHTLALKRAPSGFVSTESVSLCVCVCGREWWENLTSFYQLSLPAEQTWKTVVLVMLQEDDRRCAAAMQHQTPHGVHGENERRKQWIGTPLCVLTCVYLNFDNTSCCLCSWQVWGGQQTKTCGNETLVCTNMYTHTQTSSQETYVTCKNALTSMCFIQCACVCVCVKNQVENLLCQADPVKRKLEISWSKENIIALNHYHANSVYTQTHTPTHTLPMSLC